MRTCAFALIVIALSGCGAPMARDFGGPWRAVNRFDATPQSIPLQQPYEYFASPLDGTLKTMLARWAKDTGMTLVYQWPDDYTLSVPVSGIHSPNLEAALARLHEIYAERGMSVTATPREIRVAPAGGSPGEGGGGAADAPMPGGPAAGGSG